MTSRLRRVMAVWNWLPAVRVVAEYESVQRAARELAVSPSALSRTIRLAEDAVGAPLFVRTASSLSLTEAGAKLLAAVRTAMRTVDDGLETLSPLSTARFSAAYAGPVAERSLALAIADLLRAGEGASRFAIDRIEVEQVVAELLRGHVDFVLAEEPFDAADISSSFVVDVRFGLHRARAVDIPDGSPTLTLTGKAEDTLACDGLYAIEHTAKRGGYYAELPIGVADSTFELVGPSARVTSLYAIRRKALDEPAPIGARIIATLRASLGEHPGDGDETGAAGRPGATRG